MGSLTYFDVNRAGVKGSKDYDDWAEILSRWGVLNLDGRIANVTRGIGVILVVGAMAWLYQRWRADKEYLES
jgi:hypothetical protein